MPTQESKPDDEKVVTPPADDMDLLNDNDEHKNNEENNGNDEDEIKGDEVKEEDEENKDEEEDDEVKEEEKKKLQIYERPTVKEIKDKFPDFFKTFPSLRDAFFREQEYTKIFATVEDAKEAYEDVAAFDGLRDSVLSGDPTKLLESIEAADKNSLVSFSTSFLPTLYKRDSALYSRVVTPLLENVSRQMYSEGMKSGDEDISNAALQLSTFLFGTPDVANGKKTTVEAPPKKDPALEAERNSFEVRKMTDFKQSIDETVSDRLKSNILKDLNIDDSYKKKKCADDIFNLIDLALSKDENHMAVMNSRWKKARLNGYSGDDKARIISAYLARAKSLIPSIRDKVLREAGVKPVRKQEAVERKEVPIGSTPGGGSKIKVSSPKEIDWDKTSDQDLLDGKITLRR